MQIEIQKEVKNNLGQIGLITSAASGRIVVSFSGKEMKFKEDAFLKGYLTYVDASAQEAVEEEKKTLQIKEARHEQAVMEAQKAALEFAQLKERRDKEEAAKALLQGEDTSKEHSVILLRKQPAWSKFDSDEYKRQCNCLADCFVVDVEKGFPGPKDQTKLIDGIDLYTLGPVESEEGLTCASLGLYWELSKVFPCHSDSGLPNKDYLAYRAKMLKKSVRGQSAIKRPWLALKYEVRGEERKYKDEQCLYHAYYDKQSNTWKALQESEARRVILLENYVRLVAKSDLYLKLKEEVGQGRKVALVASNVFNFYSEKARRTYYSSCLNKYKNSPYAFLPSYEDFKRISSVKDLLEFPLPFSHVAILKAMLDGDLAYDEANGKIIDKAEIIYPKEVVVVPKKKGKSQ